VPDRAGGYLRRVGPLLLAGAVACSAAAGALSNALDEPAFELLLHLMVLGGVASSALAGMRGRTTALAGLLIIAAAVAAFAQRVAPIPGVELLYPPEVVADEDLTWATLWAWLMVGFCFMLGRRRNILFPMVAALAIFGLTATVNLNTVMLVYFAVFIFAVVFIWGYEHLLNVSEELPQAGERAAEWLRIARTQALAGTLLVAVLLAVGVTAGSLLYLVGPRLYVGADRMTRYARYLQRSLLAYGGMLNTFDVGRGPVNLPAVPAIQVQADAPALWRGSVYDHYTGRGWTKELPGTAPMRKQRDGWYVLPSSAEGAQGVRAGLEGVGRSLPGETNRQIVTVLSMQSRALYAAAQPVRVRMTDESWQRTHVHYKANVDAYGTLLTQFMMAAGAQYEVVSIMPPDDPETLRAAPTDYPPGLVATYIDQMQVQAEAELGGLVERITADATTAYDKAQAIRDFLGRNCVYSERVPAVPLGEDAAVFFVKSKRRGACDLFATSLAVMCRLAGVPARVATGFQTGRYDPEQGAYIALQRDAHAWAEVYFPEIGWVPFDVAASEADASTDLMAWLRSRPWRVQLNDLVRRVSSVFVVVAGVLALISAVLGPGVLIRWLRQRARLRTPRQQMGEVFEWFRRQAVRLAGVRLERWRTPVELQEQLVAAGLAATPALQARLGRFVDRFNDQRYGRAEPSDEQIRRARAEARRLMGELKRERRGAGGRAGGDGE